MQAYRKMVAAAAALTVGAMTAVAPVQAATTIDSSAYDISISLSVVSLVTVGLGPLTASGGVAPGSYADTDTTLGINQDLDIGISGIAGLRERVGTGVLTTAAQSPFPNSQSGSARSEVDNLALQTGTYLLADFGNLLKISADTLVSRSTVGVSHGVADATGFASLENLGLSGSLLAGLPGLAATLNTAALVNATPDPNTILFYLGVLGSTPLEIILNEQTPSATGTGISTNALHIIFTNLNVAGIGLLNGNIIVAHSEARVVDPDVAAVPEPAVWLQMIVGFGAVGLVVRRRQRAVAATA